MYTNAKDQISLEEAYRSVHLEKLDDEHSCGCGKDHEDGEKECTCNKECEECGKSKDECTCEEKVDESFFTENMDPDTISFLRLVLTEVLITAGGFAVLNKEKVAFYIDKVLGHPELRKAIEEKKRLEQSHDVEDLIKAHNMQIDLVDLAGEELIEAMHGKEPRSLANALKNKLKEIEARIRKK